MIFTAVVLIIQLTEAQIASAHPLTRDVNATLPTTGWVSDPNGRGTLSIITSCALTMGLCVWSALHLNIPSSEETELQSWFRHLKWMLMGLFGPELVVFAAWRQYVSARALQQHLAALNQNPSAKPDIADETSTKNTPCAWSMAHGFYAGMGGFMFEVDSHFASILQTPKLGPQRLTLTPHGLSVLADCGLLPDISKKDIDDKSKADAVAKMLVCLQAGWMVVQVAARLAGGLPVTLLEVNTIGHVICAFSIYVLWWNKPRLVREPTALRGDWIKPVCTFMWMSSSISDLHQNSRMNFLSPPRLAELAGLSFKSDSLPGEESERRNGSKEQSFTREQERPQLLHSSTFAFRDDFGYLERTNHTAQEAQDLTVADEAGADASSVPHSTPLRWQLALEAMQKFPGLAKFSQPKSGNPQQEHQHKYLFRTEELLCERASNWPSKALLSGFRGMLMGMALWFASIAFGGVHTAAWYDHFPSNTEAWLWRVSSLYIMGSGLLWLFINFFGQISTTFDAYWERVLARGAGRCSYTIIGFLCTICGLAYGFARIFLVVEAVISLRSLPLAAYQTPNWTGLIPHL